MIRDGRRRVLEWFFAALVLGILTGGAYYAFRILPRGELGQGEKWRVLQFVELSHRKDSQATEPIVVSRSADLTYSSLGLPTKNERYPFVWILLDDEEESDEPVKMIPKNVPFQVDCSFVEDLRKKVQVAMPVQKYLQPNCM